MVTREDLDEAGAAASGSGEGGAGSAGGADDGDGGVEEIDLADLRAEFEAGLGRGRVELEESAEGPAADSEGRGAGDASEHTASDGSGQGQSGRNSSDGSGQGQSGQISSDGSGQGQSGRNSSEGGRFASDGERHRAAIRAAKAHGLGIDDLEELERCESADEVERRAAAVAEHRALRRKVEALERRLAPVQQFDSNRSSGARGGSDETWIGRYLAGDRSEQAVSAARRAFE